MVAVRKTQVIILAVLMCAVIMSGCKTGFSREYYVWNGYQIGGKSWAR